MIGYTSYTREYSPDSDEESYTDEDEGTDRDSRWMRKAWRCANPTYR